MLVGQERQTVTLNVGLENNAMMGGDPAQTIANNVAFWLRANAATTAYRPDTLVGVNIAEPGETNATELTAVIQYSAEDVDENRLRLALDELCAVTTQEAIAVLIDDDEGETPPRAFLTGPRAEAWGPFDPSRFEIGSANAGDWTFSDLP